ncbi:unnamed protein product [Paramecium octaurelia]|uniref:Uncharacterized protein n=1 Tax=Paramecium octaurelia TaxID=43137 RepID=A0A8S1UQU8_PAROT|nr:unnamed protein product [Paramecium octaurelia]
MHSNKNHEKKRLYSQLFKEINISKLQNIDEREQNQIQRYRRNIVNQNFYPYESQLYMASSFFSLFFLKKKPIINLKLIEKINLTNDYIQICIQFIKKSSFAGFELKQGNPMGFQSITITTWPS